ncbi:MAG: L-threonylcarbamoyladenylate synthase [Chloroflexota bacterium]|nr:L-threonylcarbamoyladenylate synthase [Chloroflexota bacterium]MDE2961929.1 L-threonylcarbamoyladenylate synthase [Chloroflexota bacterium]
MPDADLPDGGTIALRMDFQTEINRAADTLARGGVLAIPTDTLYGLAADALNPDALDRVYAAKGRPADMPLPVLVSGWEQALQVTVVSPDAELITRRLAETYWPGSLTMVLPAAPGLPERLTAGRDTVAVRMPDHPVPLDLAKTLGRPITGTSANRSGEPDITDPDELRRILAPRVDGIIVSGPKPVGGASTIVAVSGDGIRLLREGVLPYEHVCVTLETGRPVD